MQYFDCICNHLLWILIEKSAFTGLLFVKVLRAREWPPGGDRKVNPDPDGG
jgi:hypothetical protein